MSLFGLFGPPNIEKLKAKGDIEGLIKALRYFGSRIDFWDKDKRWKASAVRGPAARALGQIHAVKAVEPLIAAFDEDNNYSVREDAAWALGQIGDSRAVKPLVKALKHHSPLVRKAAAEALKSLGWQPADDTQRAWLALAFGKWDELVGLGSAAVRPLIAELEGENAAAAIHALHQMGESQAAASAIARILRECTKSVTIREEVPYGCASPRYDDAFRIVEYEEYSPDYGAINRIIGELPKELKELVREESGSLKYDSEVWW